MERLKRFFGYTRVNKGQRQQREQREQRQQQKQSRIRNVLPRVKGVRFNNRTNKNRSVRPTNEEIEARQGVSKTTHATGLTRNVALTEENARVFAEIMHATKDMPNNNNNDKMMNTTIQYISKTVNEPRRTTLINHFKYLFGKPNATRKTGVKPN
jgi:hypothetical protein